MMWSSLRRGCRIALLFSVSSLLAGCSYPNGSDIRSVYEAAKRGFGSSYDNVSVEEAASSPYASIGLRLGGSPEIMLLLASDQPGQQLWTSASKIALITRDGRIVGESGLGHTMTGYMTRRESKNPNGAATRNWQADFPDLNLYAVAISCESKPAGRETIIILGSKIDTVRSEETCHSESSALDWEFTNTYWTDPSSGLMWRSEQHVHPKLDVLTTQTLRPPA